MSAKLPKTDQNVSDFMMAVLIAQKGDCTCKPCEVLRDMADEIIAKLEKKPKSKKR